MVKETMHRSIESIEQAEKILENGFIELEDAVEYLKAHDKNNAMLAKYANVDMETLKKQRAVEIYTGKKKLDTGRGSFNRETQAADRYVKDLILKGEDVSELLGIESSPNVNIPSDNSEAVEKNMGWISNAFKEQFEAVSDGDEKKVPAWRRHNADVLDKIKFVDDKGNESDEVRAKSEATIWEIAKSEVLRERSLDFDFMKLKEADRLKLLRADLSDSVARTSLTVVGITPTLNKEIDGEVAAEELAKADAKMSIKALDKFLSDKGEEKAQVKSSAVIGAALREDEKMGDFIGYVEKKQYSPKVVSSFKEVRKNFGEKMKSFWGKAWTGAKEYVANNRTRLVVDTAATLAVALSPVSYGVVAAYAAYATAGSLIWPIVEKRRKEIRQAKKEGRNYDDYKLGLKFNGLRKAWKDIKSDEKEWKRYKNRAMTGAAAGIIVAGGLGALGTDLITGVNAMAAKIGGTITRSLASVTSQALNLRDTKNDLKLEDNEENRAAYKSAKWGMGIGLTIAALTSAWGICNMMESGVEANVKGAKLPHDQANEAAQKVAKKTVKVVKKAVEENQPVAEPVEPVVPSTAVEAPTEWTPESGVSQDVWADVHGGLDSHGNMRMGKVTGILARTNAGFERWNAAQVAMYGDSAKELLNVADAKITIQDIYQNIANARAAKPELFGDMTDQQVFVSYMKLVEQTEKVMNGPKVEFNGKMVSTLITKIDKDGLPMYNNEYVGGKLIDHNSNMKKLFMIIRCGKIADISAEDIKAELSRIDLKSGRGIGEAFNHGTTNNVLIGEQGCDNGVSIWKKGVSAIKKVFKKDAEVKSTKVVDLEPVDAEIKSLQPVDASVRSVQVKDLEGVDADAQAVYTTTKVVTGRGTSGLHDGDLTDAAAQEGKKVGGNVEIKGATRKLDDVKWFNGNPKQNGGNGM